MRRAVTYSCTYIANYICFSDRVPWKRLSVCLSPVASPNGQAVRDGLSVFSTVSPATFVC